MRQLPLPDALKEHVANLRQEIALTDAEGRVVAYLFAPDQREAFYDMGFMIADSFDPAEARRMIDAGEYFRASVDSGAVASGELAVDAAVKLLAGSPVPKQIFLPGAVVTRALPTATP